MRDAVCSEGIFQGTHHRLLADQIGKGFRPVFPGQNLVGGGVGHGTSRGIRKLQIRPGWRGRLADRGPVEPPILFACGPRPRAATDPPSGRARFAPPVLAHATASKGPPDLLRDGLRPRVGRGPNAVLPMSTQTCSPARPFAQACWCDFHPAVCASDQGG